MNHAISEAAIYHTRTIHQPEIGLELISSAPRTIKYNNPIPVIKCAPRCPKMCFHPLLNHGFWGCLQRGTRQQYPGIQCCIVKLAATKRPWTKATLQRQQNRQGCETRTSATSAFMLGIPSICRKHGEFCTALDDRLPDVIKASLPDFWNGSPEESQFWFFAISAK